MNASAPAASPTLPQVPRLRAFRNSLALAENPIPVLTQYLDELGDTIGLHMGGIKPTLLTRDPGLIQHILQKNHRNYPKSEMSHGVARYLGHGLLTSEGSYWLQQRRLIQPGFHRQRIAALTETMLQVIEECLEPVAAQARQQGGATTVAVHELMTTTAFRVIARSVFSTSMSEAELQQLAHLLTDIQAFYTRTLRQPYLKPWLAVKGQFRYHDQLAAQMRQLVLKYIRQRQQEGGAGKDDLLQMLLDARYEDTHEPMTEAQVLDEAIILLVAGHETSANALSWLWYLLAQHPEVVTKLRAEMAAALGERRPTFQDLPQLPYSLQVIQETMRLYPPAWIVDRQALNDDEYNGLPLPKGTLISAYIYGVHHLPRLWPEPEAFRPERFGKEQLREQPAYAYLPFGGGPRLCIGNQFALTEMQLVLLETLRRFEVEWEAQPAPGMRPLITLRPRAEITLRFRVRA
ncbi:cytochrome P450 [Hymenobacter oligotrophus]|uniref:Cytochrome P450 n=1 Tax=Hymenobacter oligotrophus TaxID=2319843 RepID=A0A3B7R6I0_9BACT|nr:cytochrome P450 [Hymenobacter oligotrophus]AYA36951.1 cytochrome P450 [Hymenobacter oligotrophus]